MNKHLYKTNVALLLERIEYLEDRLDELTRMCGWTEECEKCSHGEKHDCAGSTCIICRLKLNNAGPGGWDEYDMNAINYLLKFDTAPEAAK